MIRKINSEQFTWQLWSAGTLENILKIPTRTSAIERNKKIIRERAIGYCKSELLMIRPKENQFAVMFDDGNGNFWWTHFTKKEFEICFGEKQGEKQDD